jgi:hypothetical protein
VLPWLWDQKNKSKMEMLAYFKKCVEWELTVIIQNKVFQEMRHARCLSAKICLIFSLLRDDRVSVRVSAGGRVSVSVWPRAFDRVNAVPLVHHEDLKRVAVPRDVRGPCQKAWNGTVQIDGIYCQ